MKKESEVREGNLEHGSEGVNERAQMVYMHERKYEQEMRENERERQREREKREREERERERRERSEKREEKDQTVRHKKKRNLEELLRLYEPPARKQG